MRDHDLQESAELHAEQGSVTYNIVLQILQDEVEHEEDLQADLEDLLTMLNVHKGK